MPCTCLVWLKEEKSKDVWNIRLGDLVGGAIIHNQNSLEVALSSPVPGPKHTRNLPLGNGAVKPIIPLVLIRKQGSKKLKQLGFSAFPMTARGQFAPADDMHTMIVILVLLFVCFVPR